MAAIPETTHSTVRKIYQLHVDRREPARGYLGGSELGEKCARRLWLSFRWCGGEAFEGRILRLFGTGDIAEDRLIQELVDIGVRVEGRQHEVVFALGHGKGHADGVVLGLEEAPKTWHLFECKTHNAKSFKDLVAKGVKESKPKHWAQMQVYMGLMDLKRAAYFAVNKDTDDIHLERVEFDKAAFAELMQRADGIVYSDEPPARLSADPTYYECKFCPFHAQCHGDARPVVSCRSCAHATPQKGGAWSCALYQQDIPTEFQRTGCDEHRYIPVLLERIAEIVEVAEPQALEPEEGPRSPWMRWRNKVTGKTFEQPRYLSRELHDARDWRVIGDDFVEHVKEIFGEDSRVVAPDKPKGPPVEAGDAPKSDLDLFYGAQA